jgi:4-amino-4-deoxy-L-arabinose transferase-like glycosyltransferase
MVAGLQYFVILALGVACFGLEVYALVDAARQRPDAFVAAGKLTKQRWLLILGAATALGFVALPPPIGAGFLSSLGFLSLIAVVAAGVYLADVRPALRQIRGGGRSGPYGPW